jgi:hypothetical protein
MEQGISPDRWMLDSGFGLTWNVGTVGNLPHTDEIEMSGRRISMIVRYGISVDGELTLSRRIVWPQLRTIPNNTHASLLIEYDLAKTTPAIRVNNKPISPERPLSFHLDGCLTIESLTDEKLKITRTTFPSPTLPVALENISIENRSGETIDLGIQPINEVRTARGTKGVYLLELFHNSPDGIQLEPGQAHQFTVMHLGRIANTPRPDVYPLAEEADRRAFVARMVGSLRFECPDPILSRMFDFAKIRTAESIFETPKGLLHGPGGGAYYAAVWCNDQCEYANPFFPYLGDAAANQSALDSYRLYYPFMGPEYAPIPSSIIAEGVDIWEGAGDRGDAAMYAYGASRFALARADQTIAHELWPAIEWCLEYCRRKITPEGVVASDSDELEGRFSHGITNLATSCLSYSGFRSATALARELGLIEASQKYEEIANSLELAIDQYFGSNIDGFATYRYHEGMDSLRSWICLPLVMGIHTRIEGTIAALLSPLLWTPDGLRTDENSTTFWDRSTLYALRGIFLVLI